MLSNIEIENVALIKNLSIDFNMNFSVFTGETGAGKSIIIDSIGFILGQKLSKEQIRNGEDLATVTAIFSNIGNIAIQKLKLLEIYPDDDGCIYLQRTITRDGKSFAKIAGHTVPLSILREVSSCLINIHGQHENQALLKNEMHIEILDRFSEMENEKIQYLDAYKNCLSIKKEISSASIDEKEKKRRIDMLKFQIKEIESAKIKVGEEEKLFEKRNKIQNSEKLMANIGIVYSLLYDNGNSNAVDLIKTARTSLLNLFGLYDKADEFAERLEEIRYELTDIAESVYSSCEFIDGDPSVLLDKIESRLDEIYKLKLKYGVTEEEVLTFFDNAKKELSEIELSEFTIKELTGKLKELSAILVEKATLLSEKRKKCAKILENRIEKELEFLEMKNVKFVVDFKKSNAYSPNGIDIVEFMIGTNYGEKLMPLSKTASGGELSRLMLAIKSVIAEKDGVETMVFDEVDTGISGKTSRRIGLKLMETSKNSQVLCVTHSAQIASLANTHYKVKKCEEDGRTFTKVDMLNDDQRIEETARIIAGINITKSAKDAAKELIENKNFDI